MQHLDLSGIAYLHFHISNGTNFSSWTTATQDHCDFIWRLLSMHINFTRAQGPYS